MKMVAILAMVGLIALMLFLVLAFIFFVIGVLDEMSMEDRFYNLGRRCVKRLKGNVRK